MEREWMDFKPLSNLLGLTLSSARGNAKERVNIGSVAMRCLRLVKNKICRADSMNKSGVPAVRLQKFTLSDPLKGSLE